jgi:hypothetical protein
MLVLRDLLHRPEDDEEINELKDYRDTDPLVSTLIELQDADGSWKGDILGMRGHTGRIRATAHALSRLGYLGFDKNNISVERGAEFLFSQQGEDGSWPLPDRRLDGQEESEGYSMIPLQTALPLKGLAACGYAGEPRTERAYDWLLAQRLEDGAWPTGIASGNYGYVAGYRKLAHSRWGCRSNTTGALTCFALHPERRHRPEARRALDLLLGRETREKQTLGFEVARLIGAEAVRGFLTTYARFDLAQMLDLCWRVGATLEDERVGEMIQFIQGQQGAYGLWEYTHRPQATRWVTFDLLRSLSKLDGAGEWISLEPRTPFQAYPKIEKRF